MATFARLKAKTANIIGSLDVTTDATVLGEWANEAVRDVLVKTSVKVATSTVSLIADTNDYTLDAAVLRIKHLYLDGTTDTALVQVRGGELLNMRMGSNVSSSTAPYYYALEGTDLLRVYPTPSSAGVLNFTYIPKPTEMSSDSHDPSNVTYGGIPVEHHLALEMYMLWRAADFDDDASSAQGERYREQYDRELKKIRAALNMKGGVRPPRSRFGPARRPRTADNSADI